MPNYCENDLYIDGDAADVAAILALIGADRTPCAFDFSAVVPYPAEYAERDAEYQALGGFIEKNKPENAEKLAAFVAKWGDDRDGFNAGGYDWCCENWGTKWQAIDPELRQSKRGTLLKFDTAWAPPEPVIRALAKRFPNVRLSLEYFEGGMGYSGGLAFRDTRDLDEGEEREDRWYSNEYRGHRGG